MFDRDLRQFQSGRCHLIILFWRHNMQDPILFFCLFVFLPIKAKKEEDDEDMEDLQRWAMEAN